MLKSKGYRTQAHVAGGACGRVSRSVSVQLSVLLVVRCKLCNVAAAPLSFLPLGELGSRYL